MNNDKIKFIEFEYPKLEAGEYNIKLEQNLNSSNGKPSFQAQQKILVKGRKFLLEDETIHSVFPHENSEGDYKNCLPHIVFHETTLPWQRESATLNDKVRYPWLALIIIHENEFDQVLENKSTLSMLQRPSPDIIQFDEYFAATNDMVEDKESTIKNLTMPLTLFNKIMPAQHDLPYLAHIREVITVNKPKVADIHNKTPVKDKFSVIIGNRLPPINGKCRAYLVSIENIGKYLPNEEGKCSGEIVEEKSKFVKLTYLKKWQFTAKEVEFGVRNTLSKIGDNGKTQSFKIKTNKSNNSAASYMDLGYVPLQHKFRTGDNIVSWYRGPFVPYKVEKDSTLPSFNTSPDGLLKYDTDISMFDTSYASAWQIGKLMAVRDKKFAKTLYSFKRIQEQTVVKKVIENIISGKLTETKNSKSLSNEDISKKNEKMKTREEILKVKFRNLVNNL